MLREKVYVALLALIKNRADQIQPQPCRGRPARLPLRRDSTSIWAHTQVRPYQAMIIRL